jgi:hypothetical protein
MRRTALAAALLAVPAAAMGQDPAPAARPTGTLLLDSLPVQADVVVETPDLRALFESATKAGLGAAASWRTAFDEQLRAWGQGAPTTARLVAGGGALLDAADGEVVAASVGLKLPDQGAPSVRATLFAMRSTKDAKALGAAFRDVVDGGLRLRWDGIARTEEIGGRPVLALPGATGTLYVTIQDGLVVVCDHALALGLFFRGLAREEGPAPANRPPAGQLRLAVRHGRDAAAWEGFVWGDSESVTWTSAASAAETFVAHPEPSPTGVFLVAHDKMEDLPLFPRPVEAAGPAGEARISYVGIVDGHVVQGLGEAAQPMSSDEQLKTFHESAIAGGAWRLGWLAAMAAGKLELPFPGADAGTLRAPYESAAKLAGDKAGEFVAWKAPKEPGHLTGPAGHGPATMLALRCLHDIARGIAPGQTAPAARPAPKKRTEAPLPEPTEPVHK